MTASPNMLAVNASARFISQFVARRPELRLRLENEQDKTFLSSLFIACSPLSDALPAIMIEQQAFMQDLNYTAVYPEATRYIALRGAEPIGRMIIDWVPGGLMTHCVDLAIMPLAQGDGIGTDLLSSWIATSLDFERGCCLQVFANNPAKNLYERLGFVAHGESSQPSITMVRMYRT